MSQRRRSRLQLRAARTLTRPLRQSTLAVSHSARRSSSCEVSCHDSWARGIEGKHPFKFRAVALRSFELSFSTSDASVSSLWYFGWALGTGHWALGTDDCSKLGLIARRLLLLQPATVSRARRHIVTVLRSEVAAW